MTPREQLLQYRQSIDNLDAALVHILAERFRCTKGEEQQISRLRALAKSADLDPDFAETFLNFIIKEVIRHHEQIAAQHSGIEQ